MGGEAEQVVEGSERGKEYEGGSERGDVALVKELLRVKVRERRRSAQAIELTKGNGTDH